MRPGAPNDPLLQLTVGNRERIYADLRERMPVYWSAVHVGWVLTRYQDVSMVLRHPEALALEVLPGIDTIMQRGGPDLSHLKRFCASLSLLTRAPRHDAIRRMLASTVGGLRDLNLPALLEREATDLLDEGERQGTIDLAEGYGRRLSLLMIGAFLGLDRSEIVHLAGLARELSALFERILPSTRALLRLEGCASQMLTYFAGLVAERRRTPQQDGLSLLIRLADEQLGCDDLELAGYCAFFFIAGEETTATAISAAIWLLLCDPALRQDLVQRPSAVPAAARELVRLASPVQYVVRQLSGDIEIAGCSIRAGEPIVLMLGAANRDPSAFPDPDAIRLDRAGPEPLGFAVGPYRCVGLQLALLEVQIAMSRILQRPGLRLTAEAPGWDERMNIPYMTRLMANFE